MILKQLGGTTISEKALDAAWLRNQAISNNIANVDTPNYKRQTVEFEKFLAEALDKRKISGYVTNEKHIPINRQSSSNISIKYSQDNSENSMRNDQNNVDIDVEMSLLSKNNIYYNAVLQQVSKRLSVLRTVISQTK